MGTSTEELKENNPHCCLIFNLSCIQDVHKILHAMGRLNNFL